MFALGAAAVPTTGADGGPETTVEADGVLHEVPATLDAPAKQTYESPGNPEKEATSGEAVVGRESV